MGKVVKACLALSHGDSFSANKHTVSAEHVGLHEDTINALRLIKDALQIYCGNNVTKITVSSSLLQNARSAYSKYTTYQEEQARKAYEEKLKAEAKNKQKVEDEKKKQGEAAQALAEAEKKKNLSWT